MPVVPMIPLHERDFMDRAAEQMQQQAPEVLQRWNRAIQFIGQARVYDAFLEFDALLKTLPTDSAARVFVQLQVVRCLREGPMERIKTELAMIAPKDAFQGMVFDYRLGWIMLNRMENTTEAQRYFDQVRQKAREAKNRPWECVALLQLGNTLIEDHRYEEAAGLFGRVYNLSRRNGLAEFIPQALRGQGYAIMREGKEYQGEGVLQKAYELATRNGLVAEQGVILHTLANVYHYQLRFYGLAMEYYEQARHTFTNIPVWPAILERLERDTITCQGALERLDIAKIIGLRSLGKLRQEYLTQLVNGFVGIPGISNRTELGERIGLTRQAIHRNIVEDRRGH